MAFGSIKRCIDRKKGGLDLTGVISDIYMCKWDKTLIRGMESAKMMRVLYKRYDADVNFVVALSEVLENQTQKREKRKSWRV